MTRAVVVMAALLLAGAAGAQKPKTEDDKVLYALGLAIGQSLTSFNLNRAELDMVKKGLTDAATKAKPAVELQEYGPKIEGFRRGRAEAAAKVYLDKAAKEKGAKPFPSGLIYTELKAGTGAQPKATDTVKVHYKGTLTDGTEFDSSYSRNQPTEFPLNGVIACWTEGVQQMKVGGKARLVCPSKIAYGDQGRPPKIPPSATLVFEIELLDIKQGPPAGHGPGDGHGH